MKKVLIITYYWPPTGGGGVQRWLKFVKYFRNFGIEPVIFTPSNPERPSVDESLMEEIPADIEIISNEIWEPYSLYKKFTGREKNDKIQTAFLNEKKTKSSFLENIAVWIRGNFFIPDARKFWIKPSIKLLTKYLSSNKIDAIISTGPPHSAHMIAYKLNKKLNIPWLADFRDPWTNIDYYKDLKLSRRADAIHHKLEKMILESANAVSVISPGMKREFSNIIQRAYHVIPNGYDKDDIKGVNAKSEKVFSLAHIGSLTRSRIHDNLLQALKNISERNPDFKRDLRLRNVGKIDINAREAIKSFGLEKNLETIDYLPHNEVIEQQQSASVLLLLVNNTPNAKLILTGKIFEYLASGRPVLCIAPTDGDAAALISETNSGNTFGFDDVENTEKFIENSYEKFKNNNLKTDSINIEKYSREALTEQMAELLSSIT